MTRFWKSWLGSISIIMKANSCCLGLDIGDRRIGIAVSQSGFICSGLETYTRKNLTLDAEHIYDLAVQYNARRIIAGRPVHLNGDHHVQEDKNELLLSRLRQKGLEVILWDERFSSLSAERVLLEADVSRKKRKGVIDKMAAVIILQNYLDSINLGGTDYEK